jgi:pantothenate synthetase
MKIFKTYEELNSIDKSVKNGGSTFQLKEGPNCLHYGHQCLIKKAKERFDKITIFLINYKVLYNVFKEFYDKRQYKPAIVEKYDRDSMLKTLEEWGVDYVYEPDEWLTRSQMMSVQEQVIQIILPYLKYFNINGNLGFNTLIRLQTNVASELLQPRPYVRFDSYKDGMIAYVLRDIYRKYLNNDVIIFEPILNSEKNLYYSTSHLKYNDEELNLISQLYINVKNIDLTKPYDLLKGELSKPKLNLSVHDIIISDKELTDGKIFVDVHYCLNNKFSNFGIFRE